MAFTTFHEPQALADAISTANTANDGMPSHIEVHVLEPLNDATLTELELRGGVGGPDCPTVEPLLQEWRTAFKHIPHGHSIQHVQFNMSVDHDMQLRHLTRFIQGTSTVIKLKAASKTVMFSVDGCSDKEKTYLEKSLPIYDNMTPETNAGKKALRAFASQF